MAGGQGIFALRSFIFHLSGGEGGLAVRRTRKPVRVSVATRHLDAGGGAVGDMDTPSADLFAKAPYCLMPLPTASSDALNRVIFLVESLGAKPLFIDPYEHDSFYAAVSGLPL